MRLDAAQRLLDAAESEARRLGLAMALAVVDAHGAPVAMRRMDGSTIVAARTVVTKARTAVYYGRPTAEVLESAVDNPVVYESLRAGIAEGLVYSMGGIPLAIDEVVVGAVAASGGTGAEDIAVAEAGVAEFEATG